MRRGGVLNWFSIKFIAVHAGVPKLSHPQAFSCHALLLTKCVTGVLPDLIIGGPSCICRVAGVTGMGILEFLTKHLLFTLPSPVHFVCTAREDQGRLLQLFWRLKFYWRLTVTERIHSKKSVKCSSSWPSATPCSVCNGGNPTAGWSREGVLSSTQCPLPPKSRWRNSPQHP